MTNPNSKDNIAWATLVATVMNLDVNIQILNISQQRLQTANHQTQILEQIFEELKNKNG